MRKKIRANKKLNKLSTITDYMKQNYSKDLSLESIARTFNYSPTYLSRMFRKYAQMSYKTYLDDLRLRHAYNDLMNTDLSIGMVAEKMDLREVRHLRGYSRSSMECCRVNIGKRIKGILVV